MQFLTEKILRNFLLELSSISEVYKNEARAAQLNLSIFFSFLDVLIFGVYNSAHFVSEYI